MNSFLYLFPTIFTVGNMFCGFWSIVLSIKGEFVKSSWLIILGILFDGIDGVIARAKKITNFLGLELDSLSDFVTFCISPMILIWQLVMYKYGFSGIVLCFLYIFFGAIRLARFNVVSYNKEDKIKPLQYIEGLPTPAAAGVIVSIVLLISVLTQETLIKRHLTLLISFVPIILNFLPAIILILSMLMVTKLRYLKFNNIKLTQKVSFKLFSLILALILLIFAYPESSIFIIFSIYLLSGLVDYLLKMYKISKTKYKS
ncbi:MAG: CDP-diacylglycerol--serine O-phosphatidyltransferase [Endomicrobiia bacterium]